MKTKYRILEKRYSDGDVRFFPQCGDWWNGWRHYSDNLSYKGCDEPRAWLSYATYEEAAARLKRIIAADKAAKLNKPERKPPVWPVKIIAHQIEEE